MINNIFLKISTIGILSFAFSRSEGIAICVDVTGRVTREGSVRNGLIRKGDIIYHGDKLIAGKNAFSSIFLAIKRLQQMFMIIPQLKFFITSRLMVANMKLLSLAARL